MRRVFTRVSYFLIRWYFWILDYIYVGFWQVLGFVQQGDPKVFLNPKAHLQKHPVILIPGIYEKWEFMKPVAQTLFNAGYIIHIVEGIGYNRGTVEEMAEKVFTYVQKNQLKDCLIVTHSKGGLIGKYLLVNYNKPHVFKGMVALNTPFSGSVYAYFLPFKSLTIFNPRSQILTLLAENNVVNKKIVSIYGVFDPHIPKGSLLVGAKNIRLQVYGHFRVINDRRVHSEVLKGLEYLKQK